MEEESSRVSGKIIWRERDGERARERDGMERTIISEHEGTEDLTLPDFSFKLLH